MTQRRRSRTEPNPERRSQLTERDLWILEALFKMRFLTTSQLARLHFECSRSASNKGLRRLLDARLVRAWVRSLAQDNVYSLAPHGARLLHEHQGQESEGAGTVPRGLDGNLEHLLAINDVRISLALGLQEAGGVIVWWRSDWELRAEARQRVIPDALFAIRWDQEAEQAFAMEIDHHTKSTRAFVRKLLAYASLARTRGLYGITDFMTLVVGHDPQWLERYRQALAHTGLGTRVWLAMLADLAEKGVAGAIWSRATGEERYSLRTLGNLPYGKEDPDTATATATRS